MCGTLYNEVCSNLFLCSWNYGKFLNYSFFMTEIVIGIPVRMKKSVLFHFVMVITDSVFPLQSFKLKRCFFNDICLPVYYSQSIFPEATSDRLTCYFSLYIKPAGAHWDNLHIWTAIYQDILNSKSAYSSTNNSILGCKPLTWEIWSHI